MKKKKDSEKKTGSESRGKRARGGLVKENKAKRALQESI